MYLLGKVISQKENQNLHAESVIQHLPRQEGKSLSSLTLGSGSFSVTHAMPDESPSQSVILNARVTGVVIFCEGDADSDPQLL